MKYKLKKEHSEFLKVFASKIKIDNGETWYYMPFWWKQKNNDVYEVFDFDSLPEYLKENIKKLHNK